MDIKLSTKCLDELFSTQQQRDDEQLAKIREIPLNEIDPFPNHPFKVLDDEDMERLTESVKEQGVITPATVRRKPDGRYELISGHRRKLACARAGLKTLRCEVVDIDEDEATVMMVDSNNYREKFLPSEKAFAYKMKLEALKRRAEKAVVPVGQASRTAVAAEVGESETQIQRYIRLTYLIPALLDQTDAGRIKLRAAVDLSYLGEEAQTLVDIHCEAIGKWPSSAQAQELRNCEGLTANDIARILSRKAPQKEFFLSGSSIRRYLPPGLPDSEIESYTVTALKYYAQHINS